jgi:hypothetical protein
VIPNFASADATFAKRQNVGGVRRGAGLTFEHRETEMIGRSGWKIWTAESRSAMARGLMGERDIGRSDKGR